MAHIGVWHPRFGGGGAESVALHVLSALASRHRVSLLTMSDVNVRAEADHYGVDLPEAIPVRTAASGAAMRALTRAVERTSGRKLWRLQAALFGRLARRATAEFDLIWSTHGECVTGAPSIQYVHYPWYGRIDVPSSVETHGVAGRAYEHLCERLAGIDRSKVAAQTLLTNSRWTASVIREVYGVTPEVLHPPVATREFSPRAWGDREDGFVCVGRLRRDKNVLRNARIVEALRDRGHDVHLHVVGPVEDPAYRDEVRAAVDGDHVHVEGRLPRTELVDLLCTHKYGIHGKEHEHFGIAVAEMVAGGMLPFAPANGGPVDILGEESDLLYASAADAVAKADAVLADAERRARLRSRLPDVHAAYGPERFRERVGEITRAVLNRTRGATGGKADGRPTGPRPGGQ